jgi:hypothetical protein
MIRLLAGEYVKLLAAWLGVSQFGPHDTAAAAREPVGKSVNG